MKEKELRIALVCFGGISLAVYMHGVSKEILKLVRASRAVHAVADRTARLAAGFFDSHHRTDPEYDTEEIYFELLRDIGRTVELRVIVDVVAGASAGGINGTMLARALAHDLPLGRLRDLWLEEADVARLLAPEARARAWSKWFMVPFLWGVGRAQFLADIGDPEVRRNLSLFVRSRWFKPPFSGRRMAELMYEAATAMGHEGPPERSLLPQGHQLDLFVALTDYYGYPQLIDIHDPPVIREREHRHVLHFAYRRFPGGEVESDFTLADAPALAFAARATSAFPGAFPPAQLGEMEHALARRGVAWRGRDRFLARAFLPYARSGLDPRMTSFLDGAVLNDQPFGEALQAIRGRPAYRQVDRRLVYIDPDPRQSPPPVLGIVPGFFATLKGALSDIPRKEPIANELQDLASFNARVKQRKAIVEAAQPRIQELVAGILDGATGLAAAPCTAEQVRAWREAVNAQVAIAAGFAYESYVRFKLTAVRALLAQLLAGLVGVAPRAPAARRIGEIVDAWALAGGLAYAPAGSEALSRERAGEAALPRWVRFLLAFDLDFRKRRLFFLIQGQNRLYQMLDGALPDGSAAARAAVDRLKRDFYRSLDQLRRCERPEFFSTATRAMAEVLFAGVKAAEGAPAETEGAADFAAANADGLGALVERLAAEIDLDAGTHDLDALLAGIDPVVWPETARREVLVNYLGFPYWDVLTLPVTSWRDAGEFDEIRVDRLSPEDARMVAALLPGAGLKGTGFAHFAAFFSRGFRENDYLLGRLHAVDRLIDIVCDCAGPEALAGIDLAALKRRAFARIVDAEAPHLRRCRALIGALRAAL